MHSRLSSKRSKMKSKKKTKWKRRLSESLLNRLLRKLSFQPHKLDTKIHLFLTPNSRRSSLFTSKFSTPRILKTLMLNPSLKFFDQILFSKDSPTERKSEWQTKENSWKSREARVKLSISLLQLKGRTTKSASNAFTTVLLRAVATSLSQFTKKQTSKF